MNEKTLQKESHQREKYLGSLPSKIRVTIFKMNGGRISKNRLVDKKTNDEM